MATTTKTVTTSLVVSLADDLSDLHLSAEIDSREEGMNEGDTNFTIGDEIGFLVFKDDSLTLTVETSAGSIANQGTEEIAYEELLQFVKEKNKTISKPPKVGSNAITEIMNGQITGLQSNYMSITSSKKSLAVVLATYTSTAYRYKLKTDSISRPGSMPEGEGLPVIIYITGTKTP